MNRLSRKVLSILLVVLLGISPVQWVLADIVLPVDQGDSFCHMPVKSADLGMDTERTDHDCEMCKTVDDCRESCCSLGHCFSQGMALLPCNASVPQVSPSFVLIRNYNQPAYLPLASLFRPPRV